MTLSDRTLTLIAFIAIGLSLLAIVFVDPRGGGRRARRPAEPLAGDDAVGACSSARSTGSSRRSRALNATDKRQQVQIEGSVRRVGVLRYDAFEDVGGRLSFSCALLDEHGTGVVLTSINGRQETRVYAKPVTAGRARYNLSREEEEAIRQAMPDEPSRRRRDDLATRGRGGGAAGEATDRRRRDHATKGQADGGQR